MERIVTEWSEGQVEGHKSLLKVRVGDQVLERKPRENELAFRHRALVWLAEHAPDPLPMTEEIKR